MPDELAGQRWKVLVARLRHPLLVVAVLVVAVPLVLRAVGIELGSAPWFVFPVLFAAAMAGMYLPSLALEASRRALRSPVSGRWLAVNSPATKVPSHTTLAYGQSHAIDLVADPGDGSRPTGMHGLGFRAPGDFPAFGVPVVAPCAGEVVTTSDWRRDHRSRTGWPAFAWFLLEGMVRELGGAGWVVGNHVVLHRDDGAHLLVAHLQSGSIEVQLGQRVAPGDGLARCGNSGNSTEPHVHLQVMDVRRPSLAAGLPMRFEDVTLTNGDATSVPPNDTHLETRTD